jgi:hypothetical protein
LADNRNIEVPDEVGEEDESVFKYANSMEGSARVVGVDLTSDVDDPALNLISGQYRFQSSCHAYVWLHLLTSVPDGLLT